MEAGFSCMECRMVNALFSKTPPPRRSSGGEGGRNAENLFASYVVTRSTRAAPVSPAAHPVKRP